MTIFQIENNVCACVLRSFHPLIFSAMCLRVCVCAFFDAFIHKNVRAAVYASHFYIFPFFLKLQTKQKKWKHISSSFRYTIVIFLEEAYRKMHNAWDMSIKHNATTYLCIWFWYVYKNDDIPYENWMPVQLNKLLKRQIK